MRLHKYRIVPGHLSMSPNELVPIMYANAAHCNRINEIKISRVHTHQRRTLGGII